MTKNQSVFNNLQDYLTNNVDELRSLVLEINSWDGSLDNLSFYENDEEFFHMHFEGNPMEAVRATQYGDYNYTDDYVRFNGYGNLESLSDWDVDRELVDNMDEIINQLMENYDNLYISDEIKAIFEEEEEGEE